jgi:peptidoglycan/LPS O-acetylase OafA/YrhL
MITFQMWGNHAIGLPGVFEDTPIPVSINVPLWTLSVEVYAYVLIFALFLIGAFRKETAVIVFGLFLLDTLLPQKLIFFWLENDNPDFGPIPFCFALGGLFAVFKDQIKINFPVLIGIVLLSILFEGAPYEKYITYSTMFIFAVYISAIPIIANLPRLPDISYGTYLWGWPVQQLVVYYFPDISFHQNFILTVALSYGVATVSWYLVEKRFLLIGKALIKRNKRRLKGNSSST